MLQADFTFTKRQLGILVIVAGFIGGVVIVGYDLLGFSDPKGGFGPSQVLAGEAMLAMIIIGITLLPLGDEPA